MAGINSGFDPEAFRTGIRFVFNMAASPSTDEQVAFYFPSTLVYNRSVDTEDVPFDPTATVTSTPSLPVRAPCAVEYFDSDGTAGAFGVITPSRVATTLLDGDYELVKGATYIVIAGDRYNYRRTEPPSGLFDVGLYVMHWSAVDET
jgi:hypothetical protein